MFFLLPAVPERTMSARNFALVREMFKRAPARRGAFSEDDIEQYVQALSLPGALTAGLNYYRTNVRSDAIALGRSARIAADTLVIWGERDPALTVGLLDGLETVAPRVQVHRIPDAGHYVQNEAPQEVNQILMDFLLRMNRSG